MSKDYMDFRREAAFPGGVLTKENESGAFGIGVDLLEEFNSLVTGVGVK